MDGEGWRERRLRTSDGLGLHVRDYGSRLAPGTPVVCLPGLTRNAKDFHDLALRLSTSRRVLSLDARGRGRSDRDPEWRNYNIVTETGDVLALLTQELERPCIIVGTSRGGLVAMVMAGVRPRLLAGVVLNDIGPVIERAGLARIMDYLGREPEPFATWEDAVAALKRSNAADFPNLSEPEWQAWARRTFRDEGGAPALDYDPAMRDAAGDMPAEMPDFWPQFRALAEIPTLVIRGEASDLLSAETVAEMKRAKPDLTAVTVRGRGHVPFLDEAEAASAIDAFVARVDADQACAA